MLKRQIAEILTVRPKNYIEAKTQAVQIDKLLEFRCDEIENKLRQRNTSQQPDKFWIGLEAQAFQTPYSEILEMIEQIQPRADDLWIDLGAGYGRVGIVLSIFAEHTKFIGYEIVAERLNEARRVYSLLCLPEEAMLMQDLVDDNTVIPQANVYFIYDFSDRASVIAVLKKLQAISVKSPIKVIARGRGAKNWIYSLCPWLCEVNPPQQFNTWTLFQS